MDNIDDTKIVFYHTSYRFSSKTLTRLCDQIENKPMAGMLVFGEGQAARSLALAGTGMKLPVLWAKGGIAKIHGIGREVINIFFHIVDPKKFVSLVSTFHSFFRSKNSFLI